MQLYRFFSSRFTLLILVLTVALAVRMPYLDGSFWMDEAAQAIESSRPLSEQLDISADFQPPLFHLVVHFFTLFGTDESWLRLSSVSAGLIAIYFTWRSAEQLSGKKERSLLFPFFASMAVALSAFHVFFSQELRQYMFAAMWGAVSWFLLLVATTKQKEKRYWILYMLASTAGCYSMYVYPFLLGSQVLYVFLHQKKYQKQMSFSLLGIAFLFAPWMPSFFEQLRIGTTLQKTLPGWEDVVSTPQWKALPLIWLKFLGGGKAIDATIFDYLYFGVPSFVYLLLLLRFWKKVPFALWYWAGGGIFLAWIASFVVPVISPKRVLFALPGIFLLLSWMIVQIKEKTLQKALLGFWFVYLITGLALLWTTPSMQRENWRETIALLHQEYSISSSVVVFGFTSPFAPWPWYEKGYDLQFASIAFGKMPITTYEEMDRILQPAISYTRVIVFDYLRDLTDPDRLVEVWLAKHGYQPEQSITTQNMGFLRVYLKPSYVSSSEHGALPREAIQ